MSYFSGRHSRYLKIAKHKKNIGGGGKRDGKKYLIQALSGETLNVLEMIDPTTFPGGIKPIEMCRNSPFAWLCHPMKVHGGLFAWKQSYIKIPNAHEKVFQIQDNLTWRRFPAGNFPAQVEDYIQYAQLHVSISSLLITHPIFLCHNILWYLSTTFFITSCQTFAFSIRCHLFPICLTWMFSY